MSALLWSVRSTCLLCGMVESVSNLICLEQFPFPSYPLATNALPLPKTECRTATVKYSLNLD